MAATGTSLESFGEAPALAALVASGDLPPVEERLPVDMMVVRPREYIGVYSDELRLMGEFGGGDMRQGLLTTDPANSGFYPNIVKSFTLSDDGQTLTFELREGLKWSDGDDFNAADFAFWYTDILQDPELTPEISTDWMPGGELMGFNVINDLTIEYTFAAPYYRATNLFSNAAVYVPEHFIKQYMPQHNSDAEALASEEGFESATQAVQFHAGINSSPINSDPLAPTLNPWKIQTIGAESQVWERNPYYWRVDTAGNQLPYADRLQTFWSENMAATASLQAMSGEFDIVDPSGLNITEYPVLKENETQGNYAIHLWQRLDESFAMGFALNYAHKDPILREIFNDLRFRQALSLAINRDEINETLFFGLAQPFTSPASPGWTGYEDWMGTYYAEYDVDQANALLDEMGLEWDSAHQWRLRSDGQPITIIGAYCTEWLAYSEDLLDLVSQYWAAIGVRMEPRFVPEETLQTQFVANDTDMGVSNSDGGAEFLARGAYPIRLMPPWHWGFAGCCPMAAYPWRVWLDTNGAEGIEPTEEVKQLYALVQDWLNTAAGTPEYDERINEIIRINVENLYYFGTVSAVPQVWLVSNRVGNAPKDDGVAGAWGPNPYNYDTYFLYP
jgi:peptide/nickel transport system substrate-binding protein